MSDPRKHSEERPIFTAVVDKFVEFVDTAEDNLSNWVPVGKPVGPPDQVLSSPVDQFIEFGDTLAPSVPLNGSGEEKTTTKHEPAA
jgi:hypothetical protein